MEMVWQDQDFLTKLVGVEYAQCHVGSHIYDPENDFPALLYYYGYVGVGAVRAFALYFFLICLKGPGPGLETGALCRVGVCPP